MSKLICASAIDGAIGFVAEAEAKLDQAIASKGEDAAVGFPDTAYALPVIYSFTGIKVETLAGCRQILNQAKELLPQRPSDDVWLPYLGNTLDAGVAALFACEIIEACKYLIGPHPVQGLWLGAASDVIMRERGIEFVDGTAPGFAAITGAAPSSDIAAQIARELQEKNLYVFMGGSTGGVQFAEQLAEAGVQLGWETRLVPFGPDVSSLIYALGFANRAALSFGGVKPGDHEANLRYNKDRIFAFVLAFGEVDSGKYAAAAGAINYGFPVIADSDIPEILPTGVCTYEHVVSQVPHANMVERALEVRGCKIRITEVPVPVPYGPAFEGERIRKADVHAEFGGQRSTAFEFVTSVDIDAIEDGAIDIIGPDIDQVEEGTALPLAIWVEVAGRKMQSDFEPILERQIHHLLNGAEGIWHMGQRDIMWTRISKTGFAKGLRLRHYGDILHAKLLSDYPAIVDKVRVTLITDPEEVERRISVARQVYDERNRRLESMTDDSVDTFYSCLLCQSFAPDHVCIITPERLGLCGAYNWLDGKAAYEIDETGPNQPVQKGACLDPDKGIWQGINDYVYKNSHKSVESFCAYSIMDRPMTSCGCFEVILAYIPECNGVMAVNREFTGDTPVGMTFSSLAGNVGGGQQTPGFMGCGKIFLTSRKFLAAEGGIARLVWMPKELKDLLGPDIVKRGQEQDVPDILDLIVDESIATDPQAIRSHMDKIGHPALRLEDMALCAEAAEEKPLEKTESPTEPTSDETITAEPASPVSASDISSLKADILASLRSELKDSITREVVGDIIQTLSQRFLGENIAVAPEPVAETIPEAQPAGPPASERIAAITSVPMHKEAADEAVCSVRLGATKEEGGSRAHSLLIGGSRAMPGHNWQASAGQRPRIAMEVFDSLSAKYPDSLRTVYGKLLENPVDMARHCVDSCGAELISVRLDGSHPERGNRSVEQSVELVKAVLAAVDVPLIITGHNHFDSVNEHLKAVAQACAGERLLLNWCEQDNYRTLAGAALAYGHVLVAQSPIDVNIGKQLNILLGNMNLPAEHIVMDAMTGAMGYGLEYTYSVMERIRLTGLGGDQKLLAPMIVTPGQECAKTKEFKASETEFPQWGERGSRAALWELSTATSLLWAGADLFIMYHPDAVAALRRAIDGLYE